MLYALVQTYLANVLVYLERREIRQALPVALYISRIGRLLNRSASSQRCFFVGCST
jgi:hypothetical protein